MPCSHTVLMQCSRASHARCFLPFAGGRRAARSRGAQPAVTAARCRRTPRPKQPAESEGRGAAVPAGTSRAKIDDTKFGLAVSLLSALPVLLFSVRSYGQDTLSGILAGPVALFTILCATTMVTLEALAAVHDWWTLKRR